LAERSALQNSSRTGRNENVCHPDTAVAGEAPFKGPYITRATSCDLRFVGEVARSARDDRVVCLATTPQPAVAGWDLLFPMRARSQWKIASRHPDDRSEISSLDHFAKHFARADRCDPPI